MSDQDTGGPYAPPHDDYDTFDARDVEQDRRGWLFLLASLVVFVLFVAVVYNVYQMGTRDRDAGSVIAPDAEPFRVAPDDPGGYQAPDQDLSVTNLREGGGSTTSTNPTEVSTDDAAPARDVSEEPVDPPQRDMPALQIETTDADALDSPAAPLESETEPETPVVQPQTQPTTPDPEPAPTQPAAAPTQPTLDDLIATSRDGRFVAQIAAYRSEADAEAGWINFVSRFPELARGRGPDIQRADLGERGVFHRLRIAAFETRADASAYCEQLSDAGQACLVASR